MTGTHHDDITIRLMHPDEWESFSRLRLRALKLAPGVFHGNFEAESKQGEEDWRRWLTKPGRAIFGLFNNNHLIGITGIEKGDWSGEAPEHSAVLWGSWIEPEWRGNGFSKLLFENRITWAEQHPEIERLLLGIREGNTVSEASALRHGFHLLRRQPETWPDGQSADVLIFERRLVRK